MLEATFASGVAQGIASNLISRLLQGTLRKMKLALLDDMVRDEVSRQIGRRGNGSVPAETVNIVIKEVYAFLGNSPGVTINSGHIRLSPAASTDATFLGNRGAVSPRLGKTVTGSDAKVTGNSRNSGVHLGRTFSARPGGVIVNPTSTRTVSSRVRLGEEQSISPRRRKSEGTRQAGGSTKAIRLGKGFVDAARNSESIAQTPVPATSGKALRLGRRKAGRLQKVDSTKSGRANVNLGEPVPAKARVNGGGKTQSRLDGTFAEAFGRGDSRLDVLIAQVNYIVGETTGADRFGRILQLGVAENNWISRVTVDGLDDKNRVRVRMEIEIDWDRRRANLNALGNTISNTRLPAGDPVDPTVREMVRLFKNHVATYRLKAAWAIEYVPRIAGDPQEYSRVQKLLGTRRAPKTNWAGEKVESVLADNPKFLDELGSRLRVVK